MKKLYSRLISVFAALLLAALFVPLDRAQTSLSSTRVLADPDGPAFYVDGAIFYHAMASFWPAGSLHTLFAPTGSGWAFNYDHTVQWQFQSWNWSGGTLSGNQISIIADPTIAEYRATYTTQYKFNLHFSCGPVACSGLPGMVLVNGSPVTSDQSTWLAPGATVTLQATPNPGWTFAGWPSGPNQSITGFQNVVTLNAPAALNVIFTPTKNVNFLTDPPNLQVYADRTPLYTPTHLPWALGSDHLLGALDVQQDSVGKRWSFASWSDGGASVHTYIVGNNNYPETVTAKYVASAYPLFTTTPTGLSLTIDGQTLPPPYYFTWGVGQTHHLAAPVQQTDAQGTVWTFKSWDDLVTTPARDVTVPPGADVSGFRLLAFYTAQSRLTVASSLSSGTVTVDGSPCATPCSIVRDPGAQVRLSAPASVLIGDTARQDFVGWSVGGANPVPGDWVGTLDAASTSVTAIYRLMNKLRAAADPSDGASWSILPASADGFYDAQTLVSLGVTARPGYRFSNWSGDLSGAVPNGSLSMSVPHSVLAQFSRVPYLAPTGVSNSAGVVPQAGVAPGSIASLYGASLAPSTEVGPASPMVQNLAGVVTHIGNRLLPLYFASPAQINLQIPPDLALGKSTLTVSSQGMPDVTSDFTIVRNAPGLFPMMQNGQSFALVLHQDGTLVTPDSPAVIGELLTLYGTGFGPTDHVRPLGIAVPLTPPYLIVDPVAVQLGDHIFSPERAYAIPGQVGLDAVQFRLDSSAPSGTAPLLHLTINGVDSNSLSLPIR